MNLKKVTLLSAAILVTLLVGAVALNAIAGDKALKLKVKWRPVTYTLGNPPPDPWHAEIFFAPLLPLEQIDTSTILLEGMYSPSGTPTILATSPPRMSVPFDGDDVLRAVLAKAPHLEPGFTYHISLTITGNLKTEYGGTPFSGDGAVNLIIPEISPP